MTASARKRKMIAFLIMLPAVVCSVVSFQQYRAYSTASARFDNVIHKVRRQVAVAEKMSRDPGRIEKETTQAIFNLKKMDERLPALPETDRFIEMVSQAAKEHNVFIKNIETDTSDFKFWKQVEVVLQVSAEKADINTWLKMVTSGKRRIDYNTAAGEDQREKVVLTIYAMAEPGISPSREDDCRPIEHTVWLWPFASRIEVLKNEMLLICREHTRFHESIRAIEQLKRYLRRLNRKRAIFREIESRHAAKLKIISKSYLEGKGQPG